MVAQGATPKWGRSKFTSITHKDTHQGFCKADRATLKGPSLMNPILIWYDTVIQWQASCSKQPQSWIMHLYAHSMDRKARNSSQRLAISVTLIALPTPGKLTMNYRFFLFTETLLMARFGCGGKHYIVCMIDPLAGNLYLNFDTPLAKNGN